MAGQEGQPLVKRLLWTAFIAAAGAAAPAVSPYTNDLNALQPGNLPDEFMVMAGTWAVKEADGGNKVLEANPTPLEGMGLLFGPNGTPTSAGARVKATSVGKRMPEMKVGLGGVSGHKVCIMPAVGQIQILRGDGEDVVAHQPYAWKGGTWTELRIRIRVGGGGKWVVEGKAWEHGKEEPKDWTISYEEKEKPPEGRASVWVTPYQETAMHVDDLSAE
jgi:hypothetical protein